tara:strand:- start:566 stop:901 length:336 start_codon:yes stop_codon:yes gene_type:complete
MKSIRSLLGWSLLLTFALWAPVSLPAGGGSKAAHTIRRINRFGTIVLSENCYLRSSPSIDSLSLRTLPAGMPINIIKTWSSSSGDNWLLVKINSINFTDGVGSPRRGWLNV